MTVDPKEDRYLLTRLDLLDYINMKLKIFFYMYGGMFNDPHEDT